MDAHSRDNVQRLLNRLFSLPTQPLPRDPGLLVRLPEPVTRLPRAKPLPQPAAETRWEAFAKRKGIEHRKRSRMAWDEETAAYAPRFGYQRANDDAAAVIVEEKEAPHTRGGGGKRARLLPAAAGVEDPWTIQERARRERKATNARHQQRNLQAAQGKRTPGTVDLAALQPAAAQRAGMGRAAQHVDEALRLSQHSTASMGRFDDARRGEPPRKPAKAKAAGAGSSGGSGRSAGDAAAREREKATQRAVLSGLLSKDAEAGGLDVDKAADISRKQQRQQPRPEQRASAQSTGRGTGRSGRGRGRARGRSAR